MSEHDTDPKDPLRDTQSGWADGLDEGDDGYGTEGPSVPAPEASPQPPSSAPARSEDTTPNARAMYGGDGLDDAESPDGYTDTSADAPDDDSYVNTDAPAAPPPDGAFATADSGTASKSAQQKRKMAIAGVGVVVALVVIYGLTHGHAGDSGGNLALPAHPPTPVAQNTINSHGLPAQTPSTAPSASTRQASRKPVLAVPPVAATSTNSVTVSGVTVLLHPNATQTPATGYPDTLPLVASGASSAAPASAQPLISESDDRGQLAKLHDQLDKLNQQISDLKAGSAKRTKTSEHMAARLAHLTRELKARKKALQASSPVNRTLSGYRLLNVVGHQAIIEELATGKTRVMTANDHFGRLVVYQVGHGQVVTNYGVF